MPNYFLGTREDFLEARELIRLELGVLNYERWRCLTFEDLHNAGVGVNDNIICGLVQPTDRTEDLFNCGKLDPGLLERMFDAWITSGLDNAEVRWYQWRTAAS